MTPSVLDLAPVVPVVVLEDAADAVPLARALVAGGLPAIEVTLRTAAALDAIRAIAAEVPDAVVGAGTVISVRNVSDTVAAGARFLVSPGWTETLLDAMKASGVPFLPGVSTTSEVVALLERGVTEMKFFPAEAAGGTAYLKALSSPLPQAGSARPAASPSPPRRPISHCPTSAVWAAVGWCRRMRWRRRTGHGWSSWRARPRRCAADGGSWRGLHEVPDATVPGTRCQPHAKCRTRRFQAPPPPTSDATCHSAA